MLYDPRWEDPMSTARIIGWLESMPARSTYDFLNCRGSCLWDQYLKSIGFDRWRFDVEYRSVWRRANQLFDGLHEQPYYSIARGEKGEPQTYGVALERARATLTSQQGGGE